MGRVKGFYKKDGKTRPITSRNPRLGTLQTGTAHLHPRIHAKRGPKPKNRWDFKTEEEWKQYSLKKLGISNELDSDGFRTVVEYRRGDGFSAPRYDYFLYKDGILVTSGHAGTRQSAKIKAKEGKKLIEFEEGKDV